MFDTGAEGDWSDLVTQSDVGALYMYNQTTPHQQDKAEVDGEGPYLPNFIITPQLHNSFIKGRVSFGVPPARRKGSDAIKSPMEGIISGDTLRVLL